MSNLLDAFRAVALAIDNETSDGIPVLQIRTYTTFHEVVKLVNETAVSTWAEGGLFHLSKWIYIQPNIVRR